jgi:hypothetical protein
VVLVTPSPMVLQTNEEGIMTQSFMGEFCCNGLRSVSSQSRWCGTWHGTLQIRSLSKVIIEQDRLLLHHGAGNRWHWTNCGRP